MRRNIRNIAASVHQRLLDKARETGRPFNELLQKFALERFIYRLSISPYANRFILKGALMLPVWSESTSRPTMDIDFLGRIDNNLDVIASAAKDICNVSVVPDGMSFDASSVAATGIAEMTGYKGIRVRLRGSLGNARVSIQMDIGFGDVIIPRPCRVEYPGLLDFPRAKLKGYTMESTIAEKFHAMVKLDVLNSRMKDFYDIWMLSNTFDFRGEPLAEAVEKTFKNRKTPMTADLTIFEPSFAEDSDKNIQWKGYISKAGLNDAPEIFSETIASIIIFLRPVVTALADHQPFGRIWNAPGPWNVH